MGGSSPGVANEVNRSHGGLTQGTDAFGPPIPPRSSRLALEAAVPRTGIRQARLDVTWYGTPSSRSMWPIFLPPAHDLVGMFLLGLLGTGHCLGMCGPIAMAIGPAVRGRGRAGAAVLYNLGRITTYVALGAVVAAIGGSVAAVGGVVRVQLALGVVAGVLLGWFGLALLGVVPQPLTVDSGKGFRLPGAAPLLRSVARGGSFLAAFPLGLLLGFLPCGLSMAAISRAVSAGNAAAGASLVAAFGVGTLPSMMTAAWAGGWLSVRSRRLAELIAALLLIAMSVQQLSRVASYYLG